MIKKNNISKSILGKKVYLILGFHISLTLREVGRNWTRDCGGTVLTGLISMADSVRFLYNQNHLSRDGIIHSKLGPSTSIINQENALQTCQKANLMEFFLYWLSLFPSMSKFVSSWQKKEKTNQRTH